MATKVLTSLMLLWAVSAEAYIPQISTITSRLARNNGKGVYAIEQEVQFRTATDPIVLRERWIVENGETMRLTVTSGKTGADAVRFDAIYRNSKRFAPDLAGSVKSGPLNAEFVETFFHQRAGRSFLAALVRARVVPASIMTGLSSGRTKLTSTAQLKDLTYQPDPMIRLGRSLGAVTWIFGEPTPTDAKKANPAAWIEQDAFVLRRLRFPSEAEVQASRHSVYSGSIRFPRERVVTWDTGSASIRVTSIKPLSAGQAATQLNPASLNAIAKSARLPDQPQIREFYSRFR